MSRLKEPSTYAGLAAAVAAFGPLFLAQPIVAAIASALGAVAFVLREGANHKPPAP